MLFKKTLKLLYVVGKLLREYNKIMQHSSYSFDTLAKKLKLICANFLTSCMPPISPYKCICKFVLSVIPDMNG